jgi:hypothetical protein
MPISLRKETIILDMDLTLLQTVDKEQFLVYPEYSRYASFDLLGGDMVFLRPHLDVFLKHCFKKYKKVILWSLGTRRYVEEILANLRGMGHIYPFHEIYTRDEFPVYKDVMQIDVNRNRTIFLDDYPQRITNLLDDNIIEVLPFDFRACLTDTYLLDVITIKVHATV